MLLGGFLVPRGFVDFIDGKVDICASRVVFLDETLELRVLTRLKRPGYWLLVLINCCDVPGQNGIVVGGKLGGLGEVGF